MSKRAVALVAIGVFWLLLNLPGVDSGATAQAVESIVINELMYHPASDLDQHEYVELTNAGTVTVSLAGWRFTDGFDYAFPSGALLPPGGYLIVAHEPNAVAAQYDLDRETLLGPFEAKRLSNGGERVALRNAEGTLVDEVTYDDGTPWPPESDGHGSSLELINPTFPNDRACSWAASRDQGTPGAPNSVYALDVPPCVEGVIHTPTFPRPEQAITITARIADNGIITSAIVYHRRDEDPYFELAPLNDAGSAGDAVAGDGIFTARLPPYPDGALVEFYVAATDDAGLTTTVPSHAPTLTSSETGNPLTVDYLFLVQDPPLPSERPRYWVLVTEENWTELISRSVHSNELLDATFVFRDEIFYNVGLRFRGETSRPYDPKSYRVKFPSAHLFYPDGPGVGEPVEKLNLVADHISRERLTHDLFQRAGLPAPDTEFVSLYINEDYQTLYLRIEQVGDHFVLAHLPGDDGGNLYRAEDGGDLSYRGVDPDDYRPYYVKKNNQDADDYTDVIALTDALDNSPNEDFKAASEAVADIPQWLRWFAINAIVFNTEGALFVGQGDDYFLYHRPSDDRFILIPWDHDSTFYEVDGDIWAPNLRLVQRILRHPPFSRAYYHNILGLMENEFSAATLHPLIDALPPELDGEKEQLKSFVTERNALLADYFKVNLPERPLTITTNGGQSFATTRRNVTLEGGCSVWRDVYVNGSAEGVIYSSIYDWRYTTPRLRPGTNLIVVTDRDRDGSVVSTRTITVTLPIFDGGPLTEDLTLGIADSPHIILDDIVVPSGVTLTVESGATLAFAEDTSLWVEGRLVAEGTVQRPITFTRDQDSGYWGAVGVYSSTADSRLAHVLVEYAGQASYRDQILSGVGVYGGRLTLADSEIRNTSHAALDLTASTVAVRRNRVHDTADGAGLRAHGGWTEVEGNLFYQLGGDHPGLYLSSDAGGVGGIVRENEIYGVQGDGIRLEGIVASIQRNRIHHCSGAGIILRGAAYVTGTTLFFPHVVNNLIHNNNVGVAVADGTVAHLAHDTLAYNAVAGLDLDAPGETTVVNSIVWESGRAISVTGGVSLAVLYSDVQGGWPGQGNMDADPQFRHPVAADLGLSETSPCIDRASPHGGVPRDFRGIPRPRGQGYDIGALEFFEYYSAYLPLLAAQE